MPGGGGGGGVRGGGLPGEARREPARREEARPRLHAVLLTLPAERGFGASTVVRGEGERRGGKKKKRAALSSSFKNNQKKRKPPHGAAPLPVAAVRRGEAAWGEVGLGAEPSKPVASLPWLIMTAVWHHPALPWLAPPVW